MATLKGKTLFITGGSRGIGLAIALCAAADATAALQMIPGMDLRHARRPEIVADAAHWILTQPARACSGNFFIDHEVLRKAGTPELDKYAVEPSKTPYADFFLD